MQRAHVVQPVGELDQQHADVVRHREHQLAQVLGRCSVSVWDLDLRQLGDAVDQPGDLRAEQPLDLVERGDRVLDRVVQDAGDDRLVVELQLGQDAGDLDGMAEIRVARGAQLAAVRLHRKDIGAVQHVLVRIRIVGVNALDEFILTEHVAIVGLRPPKGKGGVAGVRVRAGCVAAKPRRRTARGGKVAAAAGRAFARVRA